LFLVGTQPDELCDYHSAQRELEDKFVTRIQDRLFVGDLSAGLDLTLPDQDFIISREGTSAASGSETAKPSGGNPLLD